jgi:predicted RNA-binding protein with PIN domain
MQIDDQEVPQCIIKIWMSGIEQLSPQVIRILAASRPSVTQGFRPGSIDITVARERLKVVLERSATLPVDIQVQLRSSGLASSLLVVFSETALERIASPLSSFLGLEATAAALMLDERLFVRALAKTILTDRKDEDPTTIKDKAAVQLVFEIGPFLGHMRDLMDVSNAYTAKLHSIGADDKLVTNSNVVKTALMPIRAPRPKRESDLVTALRSKRQEVNRLIREKNTISNNLILSERNATAAVNSLSTSKVQLEAALHELGELKEHFDSKIEDTVCKRLDAKLLPWLEPAEALSRKANSLGIFQQTADQITLESARSVESEAIQTSRGLLARQAETDLKFGLRSAFHAERDRCSFFRNRLLEAQVDSIRPLAELTDGIRSLDIRIHQIDAALGKESMVAGQKGPILTKLEIAFAKTNSLDSLANLRKLIISSEPLGLLEEEELEHAYKLLDKASSKVYARVGVECDWKVEKDDLKGLPLYAMQTRLSRGKACTLVVDGHNILWKVPTLFRAHYENGEPGAHARKALETVLLKLANRNPCLTIHLWFDSHVMADRVVEENFRVHFSGGEGENRADRQILGYLLHMSTSAADQVRTVATADFEVATSAQASGALVMTPYELAIWLK